MLATRCSKCDYSVQDKAREQRHEQSLAYFDAFVVNLNTRLDEIQSTCGTPKVLENLNNLQTDLATSFAALRVSPLTSTLGASPTSTLDCSVNASQLLRGAQTQQEPVLRRKADAISVDTCGTNDERTPPKRSRRSGLSMQDMCTVVGPLASLYGNKGINQEKLHPNVNRKLSTRSSDEKDSTEQFVSNVVCAAFALSVTVTYQHPRSHRAIIALLQASRNDPFLAALVACVLAAFARCLPQVPRQVLLLADDSISLETALGESLRVPSCYWRVHKIFHGYLEAHFSDRPGHDLVPSKSYRILIGGVEGQVIDVNKWEKVLSKKMSLTMAVLLDAHTSTCPKCRERLPQPKDGVSYW